MKQVECVIPLEYLNCIFSSGTHCTVEPLCTDTSLIRTPLYYGQFPVSRQNFHMFFFKTTAIIWTLSNTDNGQRTLNLGAREEIYINLSSLLRTPR